MTELEAIIRALETLGIEGKQAFIAWIIAAHVVRPAIVAAGILGGIWMLRNILTKAIKGLAEF